MAPPSYPQGMVSGTENLTQALASPRSVQRIPKGGPTTKLEYYALVLLSTIYPNLDGIVRVRNRIGGIELPEVSPCDRECFSDGS